ncbi:MAG: FtsW/RodA/SpoVE family cell cycle protein [bacterium]|nr:FtsW/RodA/SpoVE family cell cycle protein [bacterium]MDZ4231542.1 FtsW/RodA/SpoVE family cell cycle protein [Patescibacteria group bacterium]
MFLFLLLGIGVIVLASASSDLGKINHDDPYYYLKDQIIFGMGIGLVGFLAGYFLDYRIYKKLSTLILLGSVGLLLVLFTPLGVETGGAQRWIPLGPFTIQPSELLKLTLVLYLAAWLSSERRTSREKSFSEGLIPFASMVGFICLILLFQNSTSAAAIIAVVALSIYLAAGARLSFIGIMTMVGVLLLASFIVFTPYRLDRVKTFLDPSLDAQNTSFQVNQSLTVIGSGGWWGVGYGKSIAKSSLPERMGDSIFAIIAEEFGFIGSLLVIFAFLAFTVRGMMLARKTRDKFGKLLLVGFASVIGLQAFVHIGSASAFIPTTGVPLPFISYGNFSLAIFMTMVGIMLNVQRNS